jgi:hypothetical protein
MAVLTSYLLYIIKKRREFIKTGAGVGDFSLDYICRLLLYGSTVLERTLAASHTGSFLNLLRHLVGLLA